MTKRAAVGGFTVVEDIRDEAESIYLIWFPIESQKNDIGGLHEGLGHCRKGISGSISHGT